MRNISLSRVHSVVDDALDTFKELRVDDRVVSARVELPLERHHSQVVRIPQDQAQLAPRDGALRPLHRSAAGEPLFCQELQKLHDAVVARRVLLEGELDERSANGVDVDGVDELTFEVPSHVQVSELRSANGATVLGLVQQLVPDVLPALADLDLVHDVGDGLHGVGHVSLAELFLRRDELDTHVGQDALRDGSVGLVPEDT
ncbi:MAG TPA: hypothetical protein VNJ54_02055 [Plantibacter sp.]|nr:hypothetical protein [Plantibacter sp.]